MNRREISHLEMPSLSPSVQFDYSLTPPDENSQNLAANLACQQAEEYVKHARKRSEEVVGYEKLTENWRQTFRNEIGEENLRKLRAYSKKNKEENYGLGNITPVPEGLAALGQARQTPVFRTYAETGHIPGCR